MVNLIEQMNREQTNALKNNRVQKPPMMTRSNVARTLQSDFSNNQANLQDYYVYSGNGDCKVGKESYYDVSNLFDSVLTLVAKHAKEKAWEIANALNLNQTKMG